MGTHDVETLLDLIDQIAFKRTVTFTRSGTLGLPDIKEEDVTATYKPLILPSIFGRPARGAHTYPARIVPGVPDTAKEHAALALCTAIVRSEDRDATMMKIVEVFGNRASAGGQLDSTALAEIIAEVFDQLIYREDLGEKHGDPDELNLITHHFRTMVTSAYKELVLDEWDAILDGPIHFNRLINVSSFYGYLHSVGMVRSWEFFETLDVILDHYTPGSLDLLMVAVIYLMSRATLNAHTPRIIPAKYWNIVLGQLNDIEVRAQKGRIYVEEEMEEGVVEMLCGKGPQTSLDKATTQRTHMGANITALAHVHREAEEEWAQFKASQRVRTTDAETALDNNTPSPGAFQHAVDHFENRTSIESVPNSDSTVVDAAPRDVPTDPQTIDYSNMDPDPNTPINAEDPSEVYTAAIDTLRDFVNEFLDADVAAGIFRAPFYRTGFVEFCLDPPNLRSNKARYMIKLCERIKRWANVKGIEAEMSWGIILEEYGDDIWRFETDEAMEREEKMRPTENVQETPGEDGDGDDSEEVGGEQGSWVKGETRGLIHNTTAKGIDDGQRLAITEPTGLKETFRTVTLGPGIPTTSLIRNRRGIEMERGPLRVDTTLKDRKPRRAPSIGSIIPFIDPRVAGEQFDQKVLKTHDVIWKINPVDNFFHPFAVKRAEMGGVKARTPEQWAALCCGDSVDPLTCV